MSPHGVSGGGSKCSNRISGANLSIVFHSNYATILLSFRHITTGWTTDNGCTDVDIWS